jgi:alkylation response protein AidB-like acyl-CoA dehydrogenase
MDFDFNQDQYLFQDATRGFLEQNYNLDKLRAMLDGDGFDSALWDKLVETGALAMLVPEEFGGLGMTLLDLALVFEEYGRALVPNPIIETIIATDVIVRFGGPSQKQELLPAIAEGRLKLVSAILESDAGFDPDDTKTIATATGDGWSLSGRKFLVPHAATADLILVVLRLGEHGPLGIAMIDQHRAGVDLRQQETLDPANRFYEVTFENVTVSQDDLLGGEASHAAVDRLLDAGGMVASILMTGIASKVLDDCVAYAGQRTQFGKPIGSFQAIKHRCADMVVSIDASRSAAYYAAWAMTEDSPDRAKAVSMAKAFCGDTTRFVCNEGVQIHGGIGFTWELGLHFYMRRAKLLEYSYGDAAYHRERVVTRTVAELGLQS